MIAWDRFGECLVCLFSREDICWIRDGLVDYCGRVDLALERRDGVHDVVLGASAATPTDDADLHGLRGVATTLLSDLPERDGVLVFRGESHRVAWAWALDELRATRAGQFGLGGEAGEIPPPLPAEESGWVCELIGLLLSSA